MSRSGEANIREIDLNDLRQLLLQYNSPRHTQTRFCRRLLCTLLQPRTPLYAKIEPIKMSDEKMKINTGQYQEDNLNTDNTMAIPDKKSDNCTTLLWIRHDCQARER